MILPAILQNSGGLVRPLGEGLTRSALTTSSSGVIGEFQATGVSTAGDDVIPNGLRTPSIGLRDVFSAPGGFGLSGNEVLQFDSPLTARVLSDLARTHESIALVPLLNEDFASRLESTLTMYPPNVRPPRELTASMIDNLRDLGLMAKDVFRLNGMNVDATVLLDGDEIARYDWELPTYAQVEAEYHALLSNFGLIGIQDPELSWFAKLLGILGVKELFDGVLGALEEVYAQLLKDIAAAFKARRWGAFAHLVRTLFEQMLTPKFRKVLGEKIGEAGAKKFMGKIMARAIPFIGWAILVFELAWAAAENIF